MTNDLHRLLATHGPAARERAREAERPVLLSLTSAVSPPEDLLAMARAATGLQPDQDLFFWQRPADRTAVAALGSVATLRARGSSRFAQLDARCGEILQTAILAGDPDAARGVPLFVGGFAFTDDGEPDGPWRGFDAGRLAIPAVSITRNAGTAFLTLNLVVRPGQTAAGVEQAARRGLGLLRDDAFAVNAANGSRAQCTVTPAETEGRWTEAVGQTLRDIESGRLEKLVLARSWRLRAAGTLDRARAVARLREHYPTCTIFWIGGGAAGFVGATPEPLVCLSDGRVTTAAIAGSAARGASPAEDEAAAQFLRRSAKDRREHEVVVRAIGDALRPLCRELNVAPEAEILCLENVQHLRTPIEGRAKAGTGVLNLVERLHPSPSVAGYPRGRALDLLRGREPSGRGWYAGPIGWMNARRDGEFAVALRCALVRGDEALLYAGAGIVEGSEAEAERAETELKLRPLLDALAGA